MTLSVIFAIVADRTQRTNKSILKKIPSKEVAPVNNQKNATEKKRPYFWSILFIIGIGVVLLNQAGASAAPEQITIATVQSIESSLLYLAQGKGSTD
ncbi:MAG: hypothetical protein C4530_24675 [Desulfobacteraceae bacterium]|nr:MAG: hypothetical protein C4530_24675 [Desulfobacteraceae bacterium]